MQYLCSRVSGPTSSTLSFRASPSGAFARRARLVGVTGTMAWLGRVPYGTLARPGILRTRHFFRIL